MHDHLYQPNERLISTGIAGLDTILRGGLPADRLYLIEGDPGTGKTTLALQYLLADQQHGASGLYITLAETAEELRAAAATHGWSLAQLPILEIIPTEAHLQPDSHYTVFHPSEVELGTTITAILAEVERRAPARIVLDSLSELRLLAQEPLRYRRQILALKQFFMGRSCTVLLLDDRAEGDIDQQLQSIVHGVISLEQRTPDYGAERRRMQVRKLRGVGYRGGYHDFRIVDGGLVIYPRLIATEQQHQYLPGTLSSGVAALDMLLGGGLDRGSSVLILGPTGVGKSSIALQYAATAAQQGDRATIYTFDERQHTIDARAQGMGIDLSSLKAAGKLYIKQIDPAQLAPDEFVYDVCQMTEQQGTRVVVIDSLNGYLQAMPQEQFLLLQLHELITHLSQYGVITVLVSAQHGLLGQAMVTTIDVSYLTDTVLLLRYFEAMGQVRQAISVVKRRGGAHERTIRQLRITGAGIQIGEPLHAFQGILSGIPTYIGASKAILDRDDAE